MFFFRNVDMNLYCWTILPMPTYGYVAFSKRSSKVEESLVKFGKWNNTAMSRVRFTVVVVSFEQCKCLAPLLLTLGKLIDFSYVSIAYL